MFYTSRRFSFTMIAFLRFFGKRFRLQFQVFLNFYLFFTILNGLTKIFLLFYTAFHPPLLKRIFYFNAYLVASNYILKAFTAVFLIEIARKLLDVTAEDGLTQTFHQFMQESNVVQG